MVARFNASEPIPDSMIPVAGSGADIIVPDMPRLAAMRRTFKAAGNRTSADASAKRSLFRGPRSASRDKQSVNWSTRIRGDASKPILVHYDPDEDLRKLVAKINDLDQRRRLKKREPIREVAVMASPDAAPVEESGSRVASERADAVSSALFNSNSTSRSTSSSFSFTVPKTSSLGGLAAAKIAQGKSSNAHIQVRNNQSMTVHVDIEPPARTTNVTHNIGRNQSTSQPKRLFSRDTASSASQPEAARGRPVDTKRLSQLDIGRRPKMLCIEVDQPESRGVQLA